MAYLAWAGFVVIAVLAAIAFYYSLLLYRKRASDKKAHQEFEALIEQRRQENKRSIEILAQGVLEQQVTLTEASIRINALLQSLHLDARVTDQLTVFRQLSEATAHIPILDRWKALSKKEKRAFNIEREEIESGFQDFVLEAAKKIAQERILR